MYNYTLHDLCDEAYFMPITIDQKTIYKEILGFNTEKENKTMNKETKTFTAIELLRIERDAYDKGYARGKYEYDCWYNRDLKIKKVIFNDPATIVFWSDGTKTVAKAHGDDKFNKEVGLTVCIAKKALGNRRHFDSVFKKWIKED